MNGTQSDGVVGMDMMKYMMPMWFDNGSDLLLLFKGFESKLGESGKYTGLLIFTAALAFSIEAISFARFKIQVKSVGSSPMYMAVEGYQVKSSGKKLD